MKLIAISNIDLASKNIGKILLEKYPFKETSKKWDNSPIYKHKDIQLVKCNKKVLQLDYLKELNPELLIIASPHKAISGIPSLTCHTPGNWSSADYGGEKRTLSISPALYLREIILELNKRDVNNYEITLEVTHHGPTLDIPTIFAEVGSSEKQWKDMNACEVMADTIMKVLTKEIEKVPIAIGFGGNHYGAKFTKLLDKIAIGHICPKYAADFLDEKMILQAFEKTIPKPNYALLDWKGLTSEQREKIIKILEKNKIKWERA